MTMTMMMAMVMVMVIYGFPLREEDEASAGVWREDGSGNVSTYFHARK